MVSHSLWLQDTFWPCQIHKHRATHTLGISGAVACFQWIKMTFGSRTIAFIFLSVVVNRWQISYISYRWRCLPLSVHVQTETQSIHPSVHTLWQQFGTNNSLGLEYGTVGRADLILDTPNVRLDTTKKIIFKLSEKQMLGLFILKFQCQDSQWFVMCCYVVAYWTVIRSAHPQISIRF